MISDMVSAQFRYELSEYGAEEIQVLQDWDVPIWRNRHHGKHRGLCLYGPSVASYQYVTVQSVDEKFNDSPFF
jgi:hypothetical protein